MNIAATVHRLSRDGTRQVGEIELFLSKTMSEEAATPERAAVSALLCFMFAEERLAHLGVADYRLCLALNVACGKLFAAPTAEIARAWPTISPTRDYDGSDI